MVLSLILHVSRAAQPKKQDHVLTCKSVAMKTRRPNLLLFNDWMNECVKHLEHSPNFIDRQIAKWSELQQIVDEAHISFGLDDTSSTVPLTESRVQAVLRWFDNRMQSWKKDTPVDMLTGTFHLPWQSIWKRSSLIFSTNDPRVSLYKPCYI